MSGNSSSGGDLPTFAKPPPDYQLRISPEAFIACIATFLAIAFTAASARTVLRFYYLRRFEIDDYFLFYAVVAAGVCAGVAYSIKDLVYQQLELGLYWWQQPDPDFFQRMLVFEQRVQVCSALIWSCIYAIKFSFLFLFRKLVNRIRVLEVYWKVVLGLTILCCMGSIPLAFIICPNFTPDYMEHCPASFQIFREEIYLIVSTTLDIFTDVLITSIPIALLWNVRIPLRKRLTLGFMLCLSCAMIIMAIVRTSLAPLPTGVIDTSWLIFWEGMEAATAVIVVSLTAFRGLFGQETSRGSKRSRAKGKYQHQAAGGKAGQPWSSSNNSNSSAPRAPNNSVLRSAADHQYTALPRAPSPVQGKSRTLGSFFRSPMDSANEKVVVSEIELEHGGTRSESRRALRHSPHASMASMLGGSPPNFDSRLEGPFVARPYSPSPGWHLAQGNNDLPPMGYSATAYH